MKKLHITSFYLIILSIILFSCEEEYTAEEPITVVHGLLYEGESPKIILSQSLNPFPEFAFNVKYFDQPYDNQDYYDSDISYSEVNIEISSDDETYSNFVIEKCTSSKPNSYDDTPTGSNEIIYFIDKSFTPVAGKEYEINVTEQLYYHDHHMEINHLKSKTYIPTRVPINIQQQPDIINDNYSYINDTTIYNYVYTVSFDDPSENQNYYYVIFSVVSDSNYFSMDTVDMDQLWLEYDPHLDDSPYGLHCLEFTMGNRIVGLNDYNSFYNGYLFTDEDFNGLTKEIKLEINGYDYSSESTKYLVIEFYHISKDYYKYYTNIKDQYQSQFDIYTEPMQLYTNIENGIGIFAGASMSSAHILIENY